VLASIDFDNDTLLKGEKIRNIAAKRYLPPELGAREATTAQ
jgi:hypothetical protein